jgi:N-acetylglucosaminyl-diphospho-decaprenol L-rhamnosyltransferase
MSTVELDSAASHVDVSIIVVTHDNEEIIERCLGSVRDSVQRYSVELFVVDNASSDRTVARAIAAAPEAHVIELKRNLGFAAANNVAIAKAAGNFVALVNSDLFPDRGALDRLISRAEDGCIGIVGGRLRYPTGRLQPSTGRFPSIARNLGTALFLHRIPVVSRARFSVMAHRSHYEEAHRVDWTSAAFCVARREVGPLPANGFMYGEDVEWARQALELGFHTWIEPTGTAVHLLGGGASAPAARRRQRARVEFDARWFGESRRAAYAARSVALLHATLRILMHTLSLPVRPAAARRAIAEYSSLFRAALKTSTFEPRGEVDS